MLAVLALVCKSRSRSDIIIMHGPGERENHVDHKWQISINSRQSRARTLAISRTHMYARTHARTHARTQTNARTHAGTRQQ